MLPGCVVWRMYCIRQSGVALCQGNGCFGLFQGGVPVPAEHIQLFSKGQNSATPQLSSGTSQHAINLLH